MGIFRHKLAQATKSLSLFMATLAVALLPTLTAIAAPGDYSWHKTPYQFQGDVMNWQDIASSTDGSKLAAVVGGGSIYTSSDAGATWTEQTAAGSRYWMSIAMSSDGSKLAAAVNYGGSIYTSSDSGATWTEQTAAGSRSWMSIAMSSDGTKLAAVVNDGSIYTSSDSGATWTEQAAAGSRWWSSIAMSSDGSKLAAVASGGSIYTSSDAGATWTEQAAAGSRYWSSIAMSSDGTKLAAGAYGDSIYTSTDSGATWTEQTAAGSRSWQSIAMSNDGSKLAAAVNYGDSIYTSSDAGATWTEQAAAGSRDWYSIAMSSDGTKLAAVAYLGYIYLAEQEGPATVSVALPSIPSSNQAEAVADPVKGATLGITSSECYGLNNASITTLSPSSVTAPANVTILGGIGYNVSCVVNGGSADATIALNAHYADTAKVHVYKTTANSTQLVDVTDKVVIKNEVINGKMVTTISYTLQDGQDFDEDGLANGTIVDPLYIGIEANTPASPATPVAGGNLASTGMNILVAIAAAAGLVATAVIVLVAARRKVGLSRS